MTRKPRNRTAEAAAINAATQRLLDGTPLRSVSGKLTVSELIVEAGLRRDVVYEHLHLVEAFRARAKARDLTPSAMQLLKDKLARAEASLNQARQELASERETTALLRLALVESSLELEQARAEAARTSNVTRLPVRARA
jgi:hypothetical protein